MIKQGLFDDYHVMVQVGDLERQRRREIISWCKDNIDLNDGNGPLRHCRKYAFTYELFPDYTNFVFDREKDAILFALKWA
jgi:hypothetical protein